MPILIALLISSAETSSADPRPQRCNAMAKPAAQSAPLVHPHKLGQEPPAGLYLAVQRRIDGCDVPMLVRMADKPRR
jgi:hypothetical protein